MAENLAQIKMLWEGAYYGILASVIGAAPVSYTHLTLPTNSRV